MALSGSKTVKVTDYDNLVFSWSATQNTANNKSTVSWVLKLVSGASGKIVSSAAKNYSVTVNGKTTKGTNSISIGNNTEKELASGSEVITHNADGTKSFTYSFSQQIAVTFSGTWIDTVSGSGTGTLTTINRASSVSATNAYIGNSSTITISKLNNTFKHTLQYMVEGQSGYTDIVSGTTDSTEYLYFDGDIIYPLIKSAKKAKITIKCITYNGSTKIGETTCNCYANCKESECKPTVSAVVEDVNNKTLELTGNPNALIKYYSTAKVTVNASARNSATISETVISNGTKGYAYSPALFSEVTSGTFEIDVTDSRGYTVYKEEKVPIVNYVKLTCALDVSAPNASGETTLNISGKCFSGNFGNLDNILNIEFRYKEDDGSWIAWSSLTSSPDIEGSKYTFSSPIYLDYKKKYSFQARITDKLATVYSETVTIKTAPVFDWSATDFNFNVPVTIEGKSLDTIVSEKTASAISANMPDYVIEQGESDGWIYRKWASGIGECWKRVSVSSSIQGTFDTMYCGSTTMARQSYPFAFKSVPVETATLQSASYTGMLYPVGSGNGINGTYASAIYNVVRPSKQTGTYNFYISLYVIGKYA